jgi:hypothetical protein
VGKSLNILHIQKVMGDENKKLIDTTAGVAINAQTFAERRKEEKEMGKMREFRRQQQHEIKERYENRLGNDT